MMLPTSHFHSRVVSPLPLQNNPSVGKANLIWVTMGTEKGVPGNVIIIAVI